MNDSLLKELIKNKDVIINLVGFKNKGNDNPIKSLELNCLGELNVLKNIAKFNPSAHHIFLGTRAQFGKINRNGESVDENQPQQPRSFYGIHKKTCEEYLKYYHKMYGLRILSLRLVGIYGPSLDGEPKHFISKMIEKSLNGEEIIINGDGSQIQDFIYIDDLVDLIHIIIERGTKGIYNAGSGQGLPMKELVEYIIKQCESRSRIKYRTLSPEEDYLDLDGCIMDIRKIKKETDWRPKTDMYSGVNKTIKWLKNREI